jgi:hypothetical protein
MSAVFEHFCTAKVFWRRHICLRHAAKLQVRYVHLHVLELNWNCCLVDTQPNWNKVRFWLNLIVIFVYFLRIFRR